jgi:opacity protein-like surface antigen
LDTREENSVRLFPGKTASLVVACVVVAFPTEALSQLGDFELTLFGGTSLYSNETFEIGPPQSATPIPFQFDVDQHFTTGLRINVVTASSWGLEAYYSYGSTTASYIQSADPSVRLDLPIQVHGTGVTALYYPFGNGYPMADNSRLTPFFSGGVGASIFRPTSEAKDIASDPLQGNLPEIIESNKGSLHYGGGVKYRLRREILVRFDVRGILAGNPTFGLPVASTDPNASVIPLQGKIHDTEITIGIGFNFGSRP